MTSIIKLCPLSGGLADSVEDAFAAHCYLLEVDQFTFLLDCGWDAKFSDNVIHELKKHVVSFWLWKNSHSNRIHI